MTTRPFGYHVEDGVATITLDRPDRLNALTFEVYRKLTDELYRLRFDDEVRVVLLTGAGKGFCSGGDVDDIIGALFEQDSRDVLRFTRMTGELIENAWTAPSSRPSTAWPQARAPSLPWPATCASWRRPPGSTSCSPRSA